MAVNRKQQRRILDESLMRGERDQLYWFPVDINGPEDRGVMVGGMLPLVPVGNEPYRIDLGMTSQAEMEVLMELVRVARPTMALRADLTLLTEVERLGIDWFIWGEHDHICPTCAAIGNDCVCTPIREIVYG